MAKKSKYKSKVLPESVERSISTLNGGDSPFAVPSGANVNRRIANCAQARDLYNQLRSENMLRAQVAAQVDNQIDGGRPFDPQALRRVGEEWRTNVNFGDSRAAFMRAALPYWKMVHEVPHTISVKVRSMSPHSAQWGLILAEAFDQFLEDWGADYVFQFAGITNDMVKVGPSYPMFEDAVTPRYMWARANQILVPKRTKANVDDWELVCLRREMTASQLIAKVRDDKESGKSRKAGWNPDMVKEAIELASPTSISGKLSDPVYWQEMVVSNDLVAGGVWPPVPVVDMWAKDRDGQISHYIFTENSDLSDYIYESKEEAKKFRHIFSPVFYDIGTDGLIHAIKGFGVRNYHYATGVNRMKCKAMDSVFASMGLTFQKTDDSPDEAPPMQQWSMINLLPKGLTQVPIYPAIQPAMALMQDLQRNQNENNYTYSDQGTQQNIASTDTKGQADLIASISAEGQTAQASIYLKQMGQVFAEIFRRLCLKRGNEDAKKFRERCKEMGLPDEVWDEKVEKTIRCGASPTMASPAVRSRIGAQLMAMAGQPGMNVRAIQEFNVANLSGAEGVANFMLPEGSDSDPRSRREAMMENNDMGDGMTLPVDPSDAHAEHADEHLKPLEAIVQQAQQGMNPQQVPGAPVNPPAQIKPEHLMALQIVLPHANQHIEFLANDNTKAALYKQLNARSKAVENITRGLVARLARTQRNGNGADPGVVNTALMQPRQ